MGMTYKVKKYQNILIKEKMNYEMGENFWNVLYI